MSKIFMVWFCKETGYALVEAEDEKDAINKGNHLIDYGSIETWDRCYIEIDHTDIGVEFAVEAEPEDIEENKESFGDCIYKGGE